MFIRINKYFYTIIYVLIALIITMMLLSYFNISLKSNDNSNIKLTRSAVFEGYSKNDTIVNDITNLSALI